MCFRTTLVAVALAFACHVAHAEIVVTLYTGVSNTRSSELQVSQPSTGSDAKFESIGWEGRPFEDAPYYGVTLAFFPQPLAKWGGSFDFTHYKMYADTEELAHISGLWNGTPVNESAPVGTRIQNLEISHGVNLMGLNVIRRWSYADRGGFLSHLAPEIGLGLVGYAPHAEGSINGVSSGGDYQWAGGGYQLFAGGEYRISRSLGVVLTGKFDAGKLDIRLTPDARLQTHTRTRHAVAGLSIHFD